ncbi:hypothetical protein NQ315_008466 [Exocentrus adspersus]|uniref:C2H2-type domain-containing protein n=1 Tax=Exocentrus adspersus TaxID=1586481 RepID=A0AAV8W5T2_9CUCU|nr:hypothetical protein NQ315_008466 [Exocentrus adspersus]
MEANTASYKINCNICGLHEIHKNDLENHISSRGHRKKLRENNRELGIVEEDRYECISCKRTFRGEEFYKAHLGSKTHRRNLKKHNLSRSDLNIPVATASVQIHRASRKIHSFSSENYHEQISRTGFIREKYKTRVVKIEDLNYKTYICSLTAYLTVRLALDQTVEDFQISVNDREWQVFGDVVVQICHKEKRVVYAIQCKKVTQAFRQIECLEEAKIHIGKQYSYLAQIRDSGKDVNETKFAIFTTCGAGPKFTHSATLKPLLLNKWKTTNEDIALDATLKIKTLSKKSEIINVSNDPENVYSFTLLDQANCHLPQLFLYTGQRIFPSTVNQLLKLKFDKYPDITTEYTKYIENWMDGKLGGNYKLKKRDVVLKLGEILLTPYVVSPKRINSKHDSFGVWNQVINKVDLTIVKNELFIISKICQPLNLIIEETIFTNIDIVTKSVKLSKDALRDLVDPIKSYFFEVVQDRLYDDIPLALIYNVFWKAGRIPLLMNTEDREEAKGFILDVILFMKQMGVHKKFLIKSADVNVNRNKGNVRIFTCLDDVKDLIHLDEVTVRVSESLQLPLGMIHSTDPFFCKWVTPNIFFDMAVGKYSLKPSYVLKKTQSKGDVLKIILNDEIKDQVERHLYPEVNLSEVDAANCTDDRLRGVHPSILLVLHSPSASCTKLIVFFKFVIAFSVVLIAFLKRQQI